MLRSVYRAGVAAALIVASAGVAEAGSVYVPLAKDVTIEGVRYQTRVWVSNKGDVARNFTSYFIATDTNGVTRTPGSETSSPVAVQAFSTLQLTGIAPANGVGMLELSGAPQLLVQAKLVPLVNGVEQIGTAVPVVSSENLIPAGLQVHLQNLERTTSRQTDFVLVNLAKEATSCAVSPFRGDGSAIGNAAVVTLPPLSHKQFGDVLASLGETAATGARIVVSCNRDYYAYALTFDRTSGEATVQGPSEDLDSSLLRPGEGGGVTPGCSPSAALCQQENGDFHAPTTSNRVRRIIYSPEAGSYRSMRVRMKVFHGGWKEPSAGLHNVFWVARDRNFNMFGYPNFKGPGANTLFFRHGVGIVAPQKPKVEVPFAAQPGATYTFDYLYNPAGGTLDLKVFNSAGSLVAQLGDRPNVNRLTFANGEKLVLDFGFTGNNPNEPSTIGWRYSDLIVELFN
jgi:hypothetical protein